MYDDMAGRIMAHAFHDEMEKISRESTTDRVLAAAPGVGAIAGGAFGAARPTAFDPGTIFKSLKGKGHTSKGRVVSGILGAGLGATTGWLPSTLRDGYKAVKGN